VVQVLTRSPMADHHLIIFATVILTAIGAMMVLSSSSVIALFQGESPYFFVSRQLIFLVGGLLLMIPVSRMQPRTLRRLASPVWAVSLIGLILVQTPLGFEINGNRNWIRVGGLLTIQPSEFAKLALVLWAATVFHNKRRRLEEPAQLLLPYVPGALALLALILAGRDLGTGLVFGALIFALLFFVGTPLRILVPALLAALGVVAVLVMGSENRMARFLVFLDPQANPDLASQPLSALYALASGGRWGVGPASDLICFSGRVASVAWARSFSTIRAEGCRPCLAIYSAISDCVPASATAQIAEMDLGTLNVKS